MKKKQRYSTEYGDFINLMKMYDLLIDNIKTNN